MEFLDPEKFMIEINHLVKTKKIDHIDAIVEYCHNNGIDVEEVIPLISRPLKEKLKVDAMAAGMMKQESKLPV